MPDVGDPVFRYVLRHQALRNRADVRLNLDWDAETGTLTLDPLLVTFDDRNMRSATGGGSTGSIWVRGACWGQVQRPRPCAAMRCRVATFGMFEAYLLPALAQAILGNTDDPDRAMAEWKAGALAWIGGLPSDLVPARIGARP